MLLLKNFVKFGLKHELKRKVFFNDVRLETSKASASFLMLHISPLISFSEALWVKIL
jgi:hypothetical protein